MIISLRGTNGSGKTHLVKSLMARFPTEIESKDEKGRPRNYVTKLGNGELLYTIGNYNNACGGCDGIQPYDLILGRVLEMVKKGGKKGHVIFEGSLVSSGYGRIGVGLEPFGDNVVFAFMGTPASVCIERVVQRRTLKGNPKPFDPKNLLQKLHAVELSIKNIRDNHKRRCVILDHRKAAAQILGLLYKANRPKTQEELENEVMHKVNQRMIETIRRGAGT